MRITFYDYLRAALRPTVEIKSGADLLDAKSVDADAPVGQFSTLGDLSIGLFQNSRRLFLLIDGAVIALSDVISIEHSDYSPTCIVTIAYGDQRRQITYSKPREPVTNPYFPASYPEEPEDVDFGLWLSNIFHSPERRKICADRWSGAR